MEKQPETAAAADLAGILVRLSTLENEHKHLAEVVLNLGQALDAAAEVHRNMTALLARHEALLRPLGPKNVLN